DPAFLPYDTDGGSTRGHGSAAWRERVWPVICNICARSRRTKDNGTSTALSRTRTDKTSIENRVSLLQPVARGRRQCGARDEYVLRVQPQRSRDGALCARLGRTARGAGDFLEVRSFRRLRAAASAVAAREAGRPALL